MKGLVLLVSILLSVSLFASGSGSKYGTGEDSVTCIKNLSLYKQYYDQKSYKDAIKFWRVVIDKCPAASKNSWQYGANMFEYFIKKEKDKDKQEKLVDSLMWVYDQRIKYFGEEAKVTAYKGTDLIKYSPGRYEEAYGLMKSSFDKLGSKSSATLMYFYFAGAVKMFQNEKISKTDAVVLYGKIMEVIDARLAKKPNKNYESAKENINAMLVDDIKPDCATMVGILKPQFNAQDADILKKIISTLEGSCSSEQLYVDAVVALADIEKSALSYYKLAQMMNARKETAKALQFYKKAIELETENSKKSLYYLDMSYLTMSSVTTSYNYASTAASLDPSNGKAYLMKARLVAKGAADCASGKEQADYFKSTVYWVAVDLCERAKSVDSSVAGEANSLIATYKAYFPGSEQIFFQGDKIGDSKKIECWFTATTTVRAK